MGTYDNDSMADGYEQINFRSSKRSIYLCIGTVVILAMPVIFLAVYDLYIYAAVIGLFLAAAIQMTYRLSSGYREVLVYDDRISIADIKGNIIRDIHYNEIRNAGVMTNSSDLYGYGDSGNVDENVLVIMLHDKSKEVIESDVSNLDKLSALLHEKMTGAPAINTMEQMDRQYTVRYRTGRKPIIFCVALLFIMSILMVGIWFLGDEGLIPVTIIALISSAACVIYFIRRYREMQLFSDRLQVVSLLDGVINEIRFRDIKHIGFLHGHTEYGDSRRIGSRSSTSDIAELVILLHDGGRQQFRDEDFDYLPDVCAFIKERIGRTEQVF